MPYNETIEKRINEVLGAEVGFVRKKMFGGVCYLFNGNMACGVYKDFLILRLGEQQAETALKQMHVRPCDVTGRPMKGWVMVAEPGFVGPGMLKKWLADAKLFVDTLPAK